MAKDSRKDEREARQRAITERMTRQDRALDAMKGCVSALDRSSGLLREAGTQGSAQRANEAKIAAASIARTIAGVERELEIGQAEIEALKDQGAGE